MLINIDFSKLFRLFVYDPADPLLFNSSLFLFLFFGLLILYWLFRKQTNLRIFTLIIFSLFFYYKASGIFFLLLIASAGINFYAGKIIHNAKAGTGRRIIFIVTLLLNLGALAYFKYTNFFIQIINDLHAGKIEPLQILLPIGISFFTFKALSYVIDIYMEALEPVESFRDFSLFIFFFPNILAGPIDRAADFLPQVKSGNEISKDDVGKALLLIISGLFKKAVIADYISLNFVSRVFDAPTRFTGVENLLAVYGYTLQIYCDFSGYSDMAIGIALLLGFRLMDNFNSPYQATSVAEFWRRWHISLSTWLLDYLFRPLQMKFRNLKIAGNAAALFITFTVCGFWHGASWAFIFWGALHGSYMVISLFTKNIRTAFYKKLKIENSVFVKIFQVVVTFHLLAFAWIFFKVPNFQTGLDMLNQIRLYYHGEVFVQFIAGYKAVFVIMVAGFLLHFVPKKIEIKTGQLLGRIPVVGQAVVLALVIWLVVQVQSAELQPFIYFQF